MFERMSAKTAALLGVVAGVALSATAGDKPLVQFDLKVTFPNSGESSQSSEFGETDSLAERSSQRQFSVSPTAPMTIPSTSSVTTQYKKDPCPACGMG
jgi:hypothetical protein